ncbi:HK97 family phage prohead protease [Flavobacterium suncheonense]|uniref:Prohead serine protease domain-containing protein n=1 Tax=Flavobacterium suncheonense GH29-5 = DSM 17707 TaxID=1121899 RepID=A0A0A2MBW2_9FLAO|nr:HK97 family phage prohead protease [Flavobacterium suncheonense]KGO89744.1 hypothetical protein Q764_06005 [Flavobacterium suncheonense GH29-5 = DSM 17707]
MPEPVIKPFVFNDETVANTYGFYILTEGIDLTRFSKNPVMLSDHWNNNNYVLGKWTDWKKEGALLTGLPDFDVEDEQSAKIKGKVERGYLSGCSMGIIVDRENLTYIDGKIFLTKCELAEVSIVPVPSNANAVRLMSADGKVMDDDEIKTLCLSVTDGKQPELNSNTDNTMKKIMLSLAAMVALGYDTKALPKEGVEESELDSRVMELAGKVQELQTKNDALELAAKTAKDAAEAEKKTRVTAKVKLGVTQGKIGADKEQSFIDLGLSSEEALDTALNAIPAKQNFSAGVHTPSGTDGSPEVKNQEDFQKLSAEEQLAFKANKPEEYKKLFAN